MLTEVYAGAAERYLRRLKTAIANLDRDQVDDAIRVVADAWYSGRQIIALGNGGSAMTALHFINDWNMSVYQSTGIPFRGRTLVDNLGLILAYGNDMSFQDIFVEQLKNILSHGDLVIAISGSGNSENVIRAVEYANANQGITLGLCGFQGGRLKNSA